MRISPDQAEILVPLEGFEPPTLSLGRSGSSTELQRPANAILPADRERPRKGVGPGLSPRPEQLRPAGRLSNRYLLVVFSRMNASMDSRDMKYREPTFVCSTSPCRTRLYSVE